LILRIQIQFLFKSILFLHRHQPCDRNVQMLAVTVMVQIIHAVNTNAIPTSLPCVLAQCELLSAEYIFSIYNNDAIFVIICKYTHI